MSEELSWELYDLFDSERYAFPIYDHASARRIVRYLLYRGILDEEIADAIEDSTADLRVWLNRAGKAMVGEWVIAWVNEVNEEYRLDKQRRGSILLDHHDPNELRSPALCTVEQEKTENNVINYHTVITDTSPLASPNGLLSGSTTGGRHKTIARKHSDSDAHPVQLTVSSISPSKSQLQSTSSKVHTSRRSTLVCDLQSQVIDIQPSCRDSTAASAHLESSITNNAVQNSSNRTTTASVVTSTMPQSSLSLPQVNVSDNAHYSSVTDGQTYASQPVHRHTNPTATAIVCCKTEAGAEPIQNDVTSELLLHIPDDNDTIPACNESDVSMPLQRKTINQTNQSTSSYKTQFRKSEEVCTCSISHFIYPIEGGEENDSSRNVMIQDNVQRMQTCCNWCKNHRFSKYSNRNALNNSAIDRSGSLRNNINCNSYVISEKRPRRRYRSETIIEDANRETVVSRTQKKSENKNENEPGYVMIVSDPVQCSIAGQEVYTIVASGDPRVFLGDFRQRHPGALIIWQVRVGRAATSLDRVHSLLHHSHTDASLSWFTCSLEVIIDAVSSVAAADRLIAEK